MKPTLLIATLSMALGSPAIFAKSELETLRALCQEQKRQINDLEATNERLRAGGQEARSSAPAKTESAAPATAKPAAVEKASSPSAATYTVKAGDNFEKIARKVGTNPKALAKANGMKASSIIHPGQKLKVPGKAVPATHAVAAATTAAPQASGKTHKVQAGETFSSISKKHGVSTQVIVAANPKVNASSLRPGQVVNLGGSTSATTMISAPPRAQTPAIAESAPVSSPAPATRPAPVRDSIPASAAPASTVAETKSAPAPAPPAVEREILSSNTAEKKIRPVTIDGEMTYGEFATKHGTDAERLNALNGLDLTTATVLAKGSELYVPAQP